MLTEASAFLAIWHDLEKKGKSEWERWHTYEHMPERTGIPGFLAGRRYMNDDDHKQCCFTIYEGTDLSVFNSAAYLERLNNPTPWTRKNASTFRNFTRGACHRVANAGSEQGYGGVILTVRVVRSPTFLENAKQLSLLDELTKTTQTKFILITHHALTMSRMDRLYGVTMPEKGISQLVSVDLQKAEELVA